MNVVSLPVKALVPHPDNPRGPLAPADVAELSASIRENGLLSPIVVTPAGKPDRFTVLAGHRRLMALKALERDVAECVVLEAGEADAMSVMLADNVHRIDLDPVRAGSLVEGYLADHPTASVADVAKKLGKPVRWVAQARALGQLSPSWRKRRENREDPAAKLGMADLVAIASLHPDAQERLSDELTEDWHFEELGDIIAKETQRLAHAPWDLDDATLLKRTSACTTCPKTSLGTPGLFEDAGDPGDVKQAICRDGACFGRKLMAHRIRAIQAARAEHGAGCVVLALAPRDNGSMNWITYEVRQALRAEGIEVEDPYAYRAASKAKGKPAYVLGGEKAGQVIYVERNNAGAESEAASSRKPAPAAKPAEEQRELKRLRMAFNRCAYQVRALNAPKPEIVLGLVRAYGYGEGRGEDVGHRRKVVGATTSLASFVAAAWPEIRGTIALRFAVSTGVEARNVEAEIRWLAELLDVDLAAEIAAALEAVPEPTAKASKAAPAPAPAPKAAKAKKPAGRKAAKP